MEYYYDIYLNFQDEYYMFYEWDEGDNIEFIKKIPLIYVDKKTIDMMITSDFNVDKEFLKQIEYKTKLKKNTSLKYACIFSDSKNSIAVEFSLLGKSISKSSLTLEDELNISEFVHNTMVTKIKYEVLQKNKLRKDTRQDINIKKIMRLELKSIYEKKEFSKLKYIYLEWFQEFNDNIDMIYEIMMKQIEGKLTSQEYHIYELIKVSYNNV